MKYTSEDVIRAFMEKTGIEINQKFNTSRTNYNPCYIDQDYEIRDSKGYAREHHLLINAEITIQPLFKNREEMHEKLKELANGFKPNWKAPYQDKYLIEYFHARNKLYINQIANTQDSPFIIYFKSQEAAQKAIDYFTDEEWKMYFGVEE